MDAHIGTTGSTVQRSLGECLSRGIREEITHPIDVETVQYVSGREECSATSGHQAR